MRWNPIDVLNALSNIAVSRIDGWTNSMTGFGTGRDKATYGLYVADPFLTDQEITGLYETNDVAYKIVSLVPREMFRKGITIEHPDKEAIEAEALKLGLLPKVLEANIWGRAFGGGIAFLGLVDGKKAHEELDEKNISAFAFIDVYDKTQLRIKAWYADKRDPRYGKPAIYEITSLDGQVFDVHETRCLIFGGAHTTKRTKRARTGWDLSVLQAPHNVMRAFETAYQSLENIIQEASVGVFTMRGLLAKITQPNGRQELAQRASTMDLWKSVSRSILLDEGETFTRVSASFSGLGEAMNAFMLRLASAADMPVTVLMGQSPAGLNATGESDIRLFYDRIATEQTQILPDLKRLYGYIGRVLKVQGNIKLSFPKLWEETPAEKATREKTEAETDDLRIQGGVLMPEEVVRMRFAGNPNVAHTLRPKLPTPQPQPVKALPANGAPTPPGR